MSCEKEFKVIIIGAGIAGISAAKTLHDNNVKNVLIIEAQDYVGGRIKTVHYKGGVIEYGAQWLHGINNQVRVIAEENDLLSSKVSHEGTGKFVREDGYVFEEMRVAKVDYVVGEILSKCEKIDPKDANLSVGEYLCREFNNHIKDFDAETSEEWKQLFQWHLRFQIVDNSCMSLNDLSAARWGDYDFNGDGSQSHINFKFGFSSVLSVILKKMPELKVNLNFPVKKIVWEDKNKEDCKVRVVCNDDTVFVADHVICTVSLGVLKAEHESMFSPQLPRNIVNAIETLGFGVVGKIILQFENSWWGNAQGFQIVREIKEEKYEWYQDISGFDVVDIGLPNCLMGWIAGKGAVIMESLIDEEIAHRCLTILENSTRSKIPPLKMFKRSSWLSNPYVRGAYSNIPLQCNEKNITPSCLQEPVMSNNVPVLLFAGEACHDTHFSTTHGAFESGEFQAERIVKFLS